MKGKFHRLTDNELGTFPIHGVVEDWFFRIEEISQDYYRVTGVDIWGRSISKDGIDPDILILACKEDINKMILDK